MGLIAPIIMGGAPFQVLLTVLPRDKINIQTTSQIISDKYFIRKMVINSSNPYDVKGKQKTRRKMLELDIQNFLILATAAQMNCSSVAFIHIHSGPSGP